MRPNHTIQRLDPPTCGCTDCLTGYSRPLDQASAVLIRRMIKGRVQDATGLTFTVTTERAFGNGVLSDVSVTRVQETTPAGRTWQW